MGLSKPMKPMTLHSRPLFPMRNSLLVIILIIAMGLLSACGGSGSGNPGDPPPAALTISTSSLPTGQTGVAYSAVLAATGGTPPYMWTLTSGTLPAGLMLNAATGAITGISHLECESRVCNSLCRGAEHTRR
jgi:Putative Ig domain